MAKLVPLWKSNPVEYLVRARFPTARLEESVIPYSDNDPERRRDQQAAEKYRDELEQLDGDEIQRRVAEERKRVEEAARQKAEQEEAARPFNRREAKADFGYWASMSYWTIDEAVALSLGRNPESASWKYIQSIGRISPFAGEFIKKREIAMRAKAMGQLWDSTIPAIFLAWAERMRFSMPVELVEAVKSLGIQIADWKTLFEQQKELTERAQSQVAEKHAAHMATMQEHSDSVSEMRIKQNKLIEGYKELLEKKDGLIAAKDERIEQLTKRIAELEAEPVEASNKSLGAKERDSLLKLVIGMAMDGYGYDPKAARSPIAKELSNHLALAGLPLDEDTVRKYLNEAKELLPGDDTE